MPTKVKLPHLQGECFFCGESRGDFDTAHRHCDCPEFRALVRDSEERHCFVAVLPKPRHFNANALPLLTDRWCDIFCQQPTASDKLTFPASERDGALTPCLPYAKDHLRLEFHLRCGNATVYESDAFRGDVPFRKVYVCDMSTYNWSHTLKDPRSWAIINVALEHRIRHLAVWTAGNAGLSLGRLAYHVNRLAGDPLIRIHTIVHEDLPLETRHKLVLWGCNVIACSRTSTLTPADVFSLVAASVAPQGERLKRSDFWDVTDGWDGIGVAMYRLLGAQLCNAIKPDYLIAPLGTGDLFVGLHLGLQDIDDNRRTKLVGVVPAGANTVEFAKRHGLKFSAYHPDSRGDRSRPVMPKLAGYYTALSPCISSILSSNRAHVISVGKHKQLLAGQRLYRHGGALIPACEPSALAGFAALPKLGQLVTQWEGGRREKLHFSSSSTALVIACGAGVVDSRERELLSQCL